MSIVRVEAYQCDRCGHMWLPRKGRKIPKFCPACHSPLWNVPASELSPRAGTGKSRPRRILPSS
jgi:rubredoxin